MKKDLYKQENNIFQSLNWLAFQEGYGRQVVHYDNFNGLVLDLPFGKKAVWSQKSPQSLKGIDLNKAKTKVPKGTVFLRIEPTEITEKEIKLNNLKLVTKNSLLSGQASPKATRALDITKTEEEILAQMKPKTRYNIRLAEKKGVQVKMLDSDDLLYEMLTATAKKSGDYHPHEKPYYTKLIKDLSRNGAAHVFVAQDKEGDFLAAILVSFFNGTATYLHGGQNDLKKNLMAPYLCQWVAIEKAKELGCSYYDFWGVAESEDPNDPWSGISRFKEGFGGEKIIFPGSFDYVINPFWYNLLTTAARIKHLLR